MHGNHWPFCAPPSFLGAIRRSPSPISRSHLHRLSLPPDHYFSRKLIIVRVDTRTGSEPYNPRKRRSTSPFPDRTHILGTVKATQAHPVLVRIYLSSVPNPKCIHHVSSCEATALAPAASSHVEASRRTAARLCPSAHLSRAAVAFDSSTCAR